MFLFNCPMYLIDILFKRLKLLYLYSQFNYCIYTNSLPLWWWLSWSWLLISLLDTLLDFRGVGGCDSPLVVVHIVRYFGRLWVIVTWFLWTVRRIFLIFCWPCISIYLFININQLDTLNFIISLFQASKCFEHVCLSSGGQIVL